MKLIRAQLKPGTIYKEPFKFNGFECYRLFKYTSKVMYGIVYNHRGPNKIIENFWNWYGVLYHSSSSSYETPTIDDINVLEESMKYGKLTIPKYLIRSDTPKEFYEHAHFQGIKIKKLKVKNR